MRLTQIQRMDPIEFERFTGRLFRKIGFKVEDTQASADEGIDLVLRRGRKMAVVQCKRYQGSVGQPVVRDLYGAMLHIGAQEAYLVTTGTITRAARRWVEDKPIHLVDGHRLVEWVRTRRLNYDKPSQLARGNRQLLMFIAVVLLALIAMYSAYPQQILTWRDAALALLPLPERPIAATSTPTPIGEGTATAEATLPSATEGTVTRPTDPPTGTRPATSSTPVRATPEATLGLQRASPVAPSE